MEQWKEDCPDVVLFHYWHLKVKTRLHLAHLSQAPQQVYSGYKYKCFGFVFLIANPRNYLFSKKLKRVLSFSHVIMSGFNRINRVFHAS